MHPPAVVDGGSEQLHSEWFQIAGVRMHVRSGGPRHPVGVLPVILVHGLGVSGTYMIPTAEKFADAGLTVHVPDLPGFGRSEKPGRVLGIADLARALADWMDAAGIADAVLVGNSMGCQILAEFALLCPGRARRMVLQGPTMDRHARTVHQQAWRLLVDSLREPPSQVLLVAGEYLRCGPVRFLKTFVNALRDPIEEKLPRIEVPVLVVRGTRDPIVSQEWAEEVARRLPRGKLLLLPGGPHTLNYTCPDEFSRMIIPFLRDSGGASLLSRL